MTTYTPAGRSAHHTLVANTVDIVTLDKPYNTVEIINDDGTNPIYVTIDLPIAGGSDSSTAPTIAGDGTFYIGPGAARVINDEGGSGPVSTVRLISAGACAYHVTGQ